jgi:DNA modification methylase
MLVPVDSLKPHPINSEIYRLTDIDDLANSIAEVGLLTPLVIDQHNQVISGNRRFAAITQLAWEKVEVTQVEVIPDDAPSLIVHHNKQRVKTQRETLNEYRVLFAQYTKGQGARTDLESTSVDINQSGLRTRDKVAAEINVPSGRLAHLVFIEDHNPELIDEIDKGKLTINLAYQWVRKQKKVAGALATTAGKPPTPTDEFTFHQKSSIDMSELHDGEVNTIITSPPYWKIRTFTGAPGELGTEYNSQEFVDSLLAHMGDYWRVLNQRGSFYLNLGDTQVEGNLLNIPHRVCLKLQEKGWLLRNTIIWKKENPGTPPMKSGQLRRSYEFIFHLTKQSDIQSNSIRQASSNLEKSNKSIQTGTFFPRRHDGGINRPHTSISSTNDKTLQDFWDNQIIQSSGGHHRNRESNMSGLDHPAPFPEKMVALPILQSTNEGDLVLDPFAGTCTTGEVANRLGRRFVGYDLKWYLGETTKRVG